MVLAQTDSTGTVVGSTAPAVAVDTAPASVEPSTGTVLEPDVFAPAFLAPASTETPVGTTTAALLPAPAAIPEPPPPPAERPAKAAKPKPEEAPLEPIVMPTGFAPLRGVHLSAWAAGSPKARRKFLDQIPGTVVNAVVVALKETDGDVYIPGVASALEYKTFVPAIPDPSSLVAAIKARGLTPVARIVIFKDNALARKRPDLAVKRADGSVWRNKKGIAWVDPYRRELWDYALDIALTAVKLGFEEIQFDYIRFPSDGDIKLCRYSRPDHTNKKAVETIREFLTFAREKLAATKTPMSVAVFGMTTTASTDMGIGQDIRVMTEISDHVSPMMYPSHYYRGEYGLANPNKEPYKVIFRGLRDARKRLGTESWKLRPYLQDFSMGYRYGVPEVQAQLLAAQRHGIDSWILWNPSNVYTWKALQSRPDSPLQYPEAAPVSAK
ncbi:MAG: putative glycoside hydrolase [Elusimicrobia bacterium]|nr:putative glycoside hydrolase [Elusimicrobiota bacterium]